MKCCISRGVVKVARAGAVLRYGFPAVVCGVIFVLFLSITDALPLKLNPIYLIAVLVSISLIGVFIRIEKAELSSQNIALLALLTVLTSGLRVLFAPLPSVQPATFIIIMTGAVFGPEMGGFVGVMTPLISNMFLGQGVYTPFMMAGWGLVGYLSGALYPRVKNRNLFLYTFAIASAFIYGWITNLSMLIFYPPTLPAVLLIYGLSLPFDSLHAVSNLIFLHILGGPVEAVFRKKMRRYSVRIL